MYINTTKLVHLHYLSAVFEGGRSVPHLATIRPNARSSRGPIYLNTYTHPPVWNKRKNGNVQ